MKKAIALSLILSLLLIFLVELPAAKATNLMETETMAIGSLSSPVSLNYTPVSTGEQNTIAVSTMDEFLNAIASDTEIILDADYFDISTASDFGKENGANYYWEKVFDGVMLTICDVSNLTIRAEGDDIKAHVISAVPRYAHVLNFENCANITLEGFTAGHTIEPGSCSGGVISLRGCENILINNCGLYGCGVVGVNADLSSKIQVANCDIYECSWGGISMYGCKDVNFTDNKFRDLGETFEGKFYPGETYILNDTTGITIDGKAMRDSYIGN